MNWALETDAEAGLRLASNLYRFWDYDYLKEGTSWLAQLLAGAESIAPGIKANALWVRGMLGINTLNTASVRQLAEESLALYQKLEDQKGIARSLLLLGIVISWDQGFLKGKPYFQESLALFRALEDPLGIAEALIESGPLEVSQSNYALAQAPLKESELLYREVGHLAGIAKVLLRSVIIAIWQEQYALARPMLDECLSLQEQLGRRGGPESLQWFGFLHYWLGEYAQAEAVLKNCLELCQRMGNNYGVHWALTLLGYVFLRGHEYVKARDSFMKSLQIVKETGVNSSASSIFTLEGVASLAVSQKEAERATRLFAWTDTAREASQNVRPINEHKAIERDKATIREMIDEETFNAAYAAGKAMTAEEAMAYALEG